MGLFLATPVKGNEVDRVDHQWRESTVSGGIGRVEHGNYSLVDLTGAYRFGLDGRQRIGVRIENLTDESYASSLGRAFVDVGGASYAYQNLGTPRT